MSIDDNIPMEADTASRNSKYGTDQDPVIHRYADNQARPEARSAQGGTGQPVGATHASPLPINL